VKETPHAGKRLMGNVVENENTKEDQPQSGDRLYAIVGSPIPQQDRRGEDD
jgi:hypothetical protein